MYFPSWPLQRLGREQPGLRRKAVVVVDPQAARGPKVLLASRRALQAGARPGMPLAEALALAPSLTVCPQDLEADRRGLLERAQAAQRYSPIVALEEGPAPESLLLDITGCGGCFGGEDRLLAQARRDLTEQGWTVRLAGADTAAAAWALAHYAASLCLAPPGQAAPLLEPLPLAALRLPPETLALLAQLGLHHIGALLPLARHDLAARFGALLLRRLDEALGRMAEVVAAPEAAPALEVAETLDFPLERFEAICELLERLTQQLHHLLSRRNLGARQLECGLYHETAPATRVELGLYRPSADPRYLAALCRTRLEQVQLVEPVSVMRLCVTQAEPLAEVQRAIFEAGGVEEAALASLIDRLSSQLGCQAVTRPRCVPDAQPEYAFRSEPLLRSRSVVKARPRRNPGTDAPRLASHLRRPLTLWLEPVPLEVLASFPSGLPQWFRWAGAEQRVVHGWGPERIETGWWRGNDVGRDYYVIVTQSGSRLWLFRRRPDGAWFLHGCFD